MRLTYRGARSLTRMRQYGALLPPEVSTPPRCTAVPGERGCLLLFLTGRETIGASPGVWEDTPSARL